MIRHKFREEKSSLGKTLRPVAEVIIAWALVEEVPILMGRMDIFDKFRIIFDEREEWIDFEG